ncbi:MAG: RecX family transcriptional regulator [Candidatus Krumholzibacteria bacterium]|nr:RecX family transcriptional regulator [Candidatus Krumholzibacteria bacterium]
MSDRIVELKPRPRDRVTVALAGGRFFTVPAAQAEPLRTGQDLGEVDVARLDALDQYFRGRDKMLRLLARRARSRHELSTALAAMAIVERVRGGILAELEEQGLVDDARFAREYVHARAEARAEGPHRLRRDLRKRGVARAVIDEVLAGGFDRERQEAMARTLVARKLGGGAVDERAVRRMADLLRRKGFDYEVVNRVAYDLLRRAGRDAVEEP